MLLASAGPHLHPAPHIGPTLHPHLSPKPSSHVSHAHGPQQHVCPAPFQQRVHRRALSARAVNSAPSPSQQGSPQESQPKSPIVDALYSTQQGTPEQRTWRIRPYASSDFSALVQLQTDSFHTPMPFKLLDRLAKTSLRAEVLDGLRQKEKHSDPDSYVVLVADDVTQEAQQHSSQSSQPQSEQLEPSSEDRKVQAVVEVRIEVMRENEREVLEQLEYGLAEYTYISSMAVAEKNRRRGLASAVLSAAEQQSRIWDQPHVALHVYEDNLPAVQMYTKMGMRILKKDPLLKKILGGRIRLLMYKNLELDQALS